MNVLGMSRHDVPLKVDPMVDTRIPPSSSSTSALVAARKKPVRPERRTVSHRRTGNKAPESATAINAELIIMIERRERAWSASELAELLGCSDKHIYSLAKSGRIPHLRIGGVIRFDPGATAAWLRERYIAA